MFCSGSHLGIPINIKNTKLLNLKSHFAADALGDSIRFGIFEVYQFHPGT
jgi:hypothetical protein